MLPILRQRAFTARRFYGQQRNKMTINKVEACKSSVKQRPTPILLLRTDLSDSSNEWAQSMQDQFSKLGYYSIDATITLPEKKDRDSLLLQTSYQELNQATSDLSYYPPLIVSYGEIASRISQKFVSNKPASGLVMIEQENEPWKKVYDVEFPISEFEPRFPLFWISNQAPPEFLDGWIDQVEERKAGQEFQDLIHWMDEIGM